MTDPTDPRITTDGGTTVYLDTIDDETIIRLHRPHDPGSLLQHYEAGRIALGGFQPIAHAPYALGPDALRAIADLIERSTP